VFQFLITFKFTVIFSSQKTPLFKIRECIEDIKK